MNDAKINRRQALGWVGGLLIAGCSRGPEQGKPISITEESNPMPRVSDSWGRIHKWLGDNAPKILGNLNPAASEAEITAAQNALQVTLPEEWRQLYSVHNGMNHTGNFGSLFFGMRFLALDEVIREYKDSATAHDPVPIGNADAGIRKQDIHNPKWIALAHDGGDTLLRVDMDPDGGGSKGQIIFTDHAHNVGILLAPSIRQFLSNFADDLENGQYFLEPGALHDGNQFLSCVKEIDIVNWWSSPRWKHLDK